MQVPPALLTFLKTLCNAGTTLEVTPQNIFPRIGNCKSLEKNSTISQTVSFKCMPIQRHTQNASPKNDPLKTRSAHLLSATYRDRQLPQCTEQKRTWFTESGILQNRLEIKLHTCATYPSSCIIAQSVFSGKLYHSITLLFKPL